MDELASKLNDLLGSSDGMEKIRNLAGMLGGASGQKSGQTSSDPLSDLLGSPEGMEKIRNLAGILGGASGQKSGQTSSNPLSDLLGSPEGMEKIRNLAGILGGASDQTPSQQARQDPPAPPETGSTAPEGDRDLMRTIMKMAPLLARFRKEDDSTRLLRCLRPFLSDTKKKKLDEAVKLLQFIRVIPYLKDSGLF